MAMASHQRPMDVVIAGAGICGLSTAYFLSTRYKIASTVVEWTGEIAPAASGKAAGFLAKDWNDGSPLQRLNHRSFDLHQELADTLGADKIDYRRVTCAFVGFSNKRRTPSKKAKSLEWVHTDKASSVEITGDESTLAQVHPRKLCEQLWEATKRETESKLIQGRVVGAVHTDGKLTGAKLDDGTVVEADALLYACGAWTADNVTGSKGHSVVMPTERVWNQCVFFTGPLSFEGFVRPDQTVYCSGYPEDDIVVKERPGQETPTREAIDNIIKGMKESSSIALEPGEGHACYQPTTPDGLPIMGAVVGEPQCYVAVGHSCWGITLGPATGEVMADLIATGRKSNSHVNLRSFDPARFGKVKMVPS